MNVLVDTNIYIDFLGKRRYWRAAQRFFNDTVSCKHKIFIIDKIIRELERNEIVNEFYETIEFELNKKNKLEFISFSRKDVEEAFKLSRLKNIPFVDTLIAIVAKNNNLIVVTRDKHFFLDLAEIISVYKPEELF